MSETDKPVRDWEWLALTDHYHTALAIREALLEGDVEDAAEGLEELIDALSRSEERALESHLIRLIQHVIKWQVQPEKRSPSWVYTIREQRRQIRKLQRRYPRFTDCRIEEALWDDCLVGGLNEAGKDMDQDILNPPSLSWQDVFETDYHLES
ncbi:MAG: hypothetical protein ETSY1_21065 [Candidatus Entotheonella factor]|uniref:DUF29 domain-containing protein n=1 Tax=Entotheonella factor TaxID=1429438 RepID=W4LIX4_ENTF1|nr:DUF29 family protein [Candidatus Entotheonella palauensis]ETW97849.1 MAG: hypothetical protein ETSY1_21065 [Candidatus Entotheonella factor]